MSEEKGSAAKALEGDESVDRELEEIAEDPPKNLEDWPGGKAKYKTFGGPESETGYDEGPTSNLGPADLRHHEDGSVSIKGEKVDNPEDYKTDPIPGGPTDPDAPVDPGQEENLDDSDRDG
jgi:hypothetical protein